jgi:hypothetical protein
MCFRLNWRRPDNRQRISRSEIIFLAVLAEGLRILFRLRIYCPYEPALIGCCYPGESSQNETIAAIYIAGTEISLR